MLFANFAEAVAEGRGKAQADALRATRSDTQAKLLLHPGRSQGRSLGAEGRRPAEVGDVVLVEAGDTIPADGEVDRGHRLGQRVGGDRRIRPVIRESGGDRSAVTGGTVVVSDWIKVRVTSEQGQTFLDRMIALVEGAERQKTPNELALSILLSGMTLIFLIAVVTLWGLAGYSGTVLSITVLVSLLVTLIPTTIGGLLSAIGIAGMDRLIRFNVMATSGRAVEAAGDVDTCCCSTRPAPSPSATAWPPSSSPSRGPACGRSLKPPSWPRSPTRRRRAARSSSLAKQAFGIRERDLGKLGAKFVPFSAQTRISGVDVDGRSIRKGAVDAVLKSLGMTIASAPAAFREAVEAHLALGRHAARRRRRRRAARRHPPQGRGEAGHQGAVRGLARHGHQDRHGDRRQSGHGRGDRVGGRRRRLHRRGDAAGQARLHQGRAGEGPPDRHVRRRHQRRPALAQADVGVAMQSGTQAAREAGNMVDLDSNPTKLIEVTEIGKQLLMTRGSLTTFSIANDVAKYFAIIPALFVATYPELGALNVMGLASPQSAILSAVIFNALIIVALIPLALKGVAYRASAPPPCCAATCSSTASAASSCRSSASSSSTSPSRPCISPEGDVPCSRISVPPRPAGAVHRS